MAKSDFATLLRFEDSERRDSCDAFTTVALGISLILYTSAVFARLGTGKLPSILPLMLSTTIILLPHAFKKRVALRLPILQALVLLFFLAIGWISVLLRMDLTFVLYLSFIAAVYFFINQEKIRVEKRMLTKWIVVVCLSMVLLKQVWTKNYLNPLAPEAYAGGLGFVHQDTFYLSSITAMLKTYQVASAGLFGLQELTYHIASNVLFASLAQLCKISVLEFYNIAYPIIFVPLLCQAMLFAVVINPRVKLGYGRIIIYLIVLFFILSELVGSRIGTNFYSPTTYNSHFISQSYCLSLILAFWAIAIYYPFLMKEVRLHANSKVQNILIMMIPVWILIIGYAKISTAAIMLTGFLYVVVRRKLFFRALLAMSAAVSVLSMFLVFMLTAETTDSTFTLRFGEYYNTQDFDGRLLPYLLLTYCWLIIFVAITWVIIFRSTDNGIYRRSVFEKQILMETLVVTAFVGILPALLFNIESSGYFSDVQYWLSAVAVMSVTPYFVFRLRKTTRKVIVIPVAIAIAVISFTGFYTFCRKNYQGRFALAYGRQADFSEFMKTASFRTLINPLGLSLNTSENYGKQVSNHLNLELFESLRNLPPDLKEESVIYCEDILELRNFLECPAILFYLPAITEMATINGLFWRDCLPPHRYSMHLHANDPTYITKESAFVQARKSGFSNVIVVNLTSKTYEIVKV